MYPLNEWGQLKKVIVGVADYAMLPEIDYSVRAVCHADKDDLLEIKVGPYPPEVIDQTNEELEIFCNFLVEQGIEVLRPNREPVKYYNYCPRDTVFVHKDVALATPTPIIARKDEYKSMAHHIDNLIVANRDYSDLDYDLGCVGNKDILALKERVPLFDAANVLRANDDLLYLVSNSGNEKGAEYLQEVVGSDTKVHIIRDIYSFMHIDSTIAFLREGLMLLNPSRIKDKSILPAPFCNWDAIFAPEPIDKGHYPGICNSSPWGLNVNLLSINSELAVLQQDQHNLRVILESQGIECVMMPLSHVRTFAGCFHCITLDLDRDDT